jgi:16S rRNA (cytidine1402-2'-O)-methyltransferase
MHAMIKRDYDSLLRRLLRRFPSVTMLGPRQCGKTTFIRAALSTWTYLDLERPSDSAPLVSDPGFKLVRAARDAGHAVTALPGPSATLAALASAGLPTDRFFFEGFLPAKPGQRKSRIAELARIPATLILFESGPRLPAALADLAAGLDGREAAVCRELTKLHEEVRRGKLAELAQVYADGAETRGEIVIVVAPPPADAATLDDGKIDALLRSALDRASVKDAVSEVASATGRPRREIYARALALNEKHDDGASS